MARTSSHPEPQQRVLRVLRQRAGLSQDRLAELSGISQTAISFYEHGLRIPDNINRRLKFSLEQYLDRGSENLDLDLSSVYEEPE